MMSNTRIMTNLVNSYPKDKHHQSYSNTGGGLCLSKLG